jgi:hypothetical protein
MVISTTTTSGLRRSTSDTSDIPSFAVPTSSKRDDSRSASASRNSRWSSAKKMRGRIKARSVQNALAVAFGANGAALTLGDVREGKRTPLLGKSLASNPQFAGSLTSCWGRFSLARPVRAQRRVAIFYTLSPGSRLSGREILSVVPFPDSERTSNFPPNERARSSMLRKPNPSLSRKPRTLNPQPSSCTMTSNLLPIIRRLTFALSAPLCFLRFRSPS